MPKTLRSKPVSSIALLALLPLAFFLAACNPLITTTPTLLAVTPSVPPQVTPGNRSTIQLAADYLAAIASSDQARLDLLIGADAWCSTPDSAATIKKQFEAFRATRMRNVRIETLDIRGWVAYPPGSEAARISFEYQKIDSQEWKTASMSVVTAPSPTTQARFICSVTD